MSHVNPLGINEICLQMIGGCPQSSVPMMDVAPPFNGYAVAVPQVDEDDFEAARIAVKEGGRESAVREAEANADGGGTGGIRLEWPIRRRE